MYKQTVIAGLTLAAISLGTVASARAELANDIDPLTIKRIESQTTSSGNRNNEPVRDTSSDRPQIATNSQQSMLYVKQGWTLQKRGNKRQALVYYYQALKADRTNAVAFLAAGNLLGNTKEGITCMKAAATLFEAQGNREGYDIAMNWLAQRGAID
jgi:tetratricopeptide (TPR) repeat protein